MRVRNQGDRGERFDEEGTRIQVRLADIRADSQGCDIRAGVDVRLVHDRPGGRRTVSETPMVSDDGPRLRVRLRGVKQNRVPRVNRTWRPNKKDRGGGGGVAGDGPGCGRGPAGPSDARGDV